jgi:two-component system NarL family sensor kinase
MFNPLKSESPPESETTRLAMEACEHIISEMGAELHDDLIQKLSVFRLYLDRLERSKTDPTEIESLLEKMNADYQEVAQSVRRISRRLLPVKMEDDSFQTSISLLCQNMERPGGGTIHFQPDGTEKKLPSLAEVYLYRIIQELIHNALKHSSAWHVWVRLMWHTDHLRIEVEDDGTGFSKMSEFISSLKGRHNTLRMRTNVIGATIQYLKGTKGLLARVNYQV